MTQEEKAKAYDEALEMAKNVLETDLHESGVWAIKKIFPELKESEDERIRKALIDGVRQIRCKNGITQEQMLAWLEKQKINTEGDFGRGYNCGYKACLNSHGAEFFERQKEQKPEWSEEDEENLNTVLDMVKYCSVVPPENVPRSTGHLHPTEKYKKELTNWLKSFKDRGNFPKSNTNSPKQEWSEEDKHRCKDAIYFLETAKKHYADTSELEKCIEWLKGLQPTEGIKGNLEEIPSNVDLEKAAGDYIVQLNMEDLEGGFNAAFNAFKAGAEWQKKQFSDILDKWEAHAIEGMKVGASAYHQGKIALICDLRDWIKEQTKK